MEAAGQQHLIALASGQRTRLARADLKARIRRGEVTVVSVLLDPPRYALTMPIGKLVGAQWRWGTYRTRNVLAAAKCSEARQLGELTDRQRQIIAEAIG